MKNDETMFKELKQMNNDLEKKIMEYDQDIKRRTKEYDQKFKEFVRSGAAGRMAYFKKHGKEYDGDGCPFFEPKEEDV